MTTMNIYLLGVYHNFQTEKHLEFLSFLRHTCSTYNIRSIAEEMNIDALYLAKVEKSTVYEISEELGLPHAYCDPDETERENHNILGQEAIESHQWFNNLSTEEVESLKSEHNIKREKIWLEKLKAVIVDPMLFICGIQHLGSFSSLLKKNGYECYILEKKWSPNKSLESDA